MNIKDVSNWNMDGIELVHLEDYKCQDDKLIAVAIKLALFTRLINKP